MPANKYALLRYRIIDRCITNPGRPYPTKEDLREACEEALYGSIGEHISISTIEKDMWAMKNESELGYFAPIAYSRDLRGYYYEEEDYTIQDITLKDEEFDAIRLAAQTLDQFREIEIFKEYNSAIDKIMNRLSIQPQEVRKTRQVIQFESAPETRGQQHLNQLFRLTENRQIATFDYHKFGHDSCRSYSVHPYFLKEYRNRWYLIAFEPRRDRYVTFGLDRIENLEDKDERFEIRSDFDPDRFFKYSIGITQTTSDPQKVVLRTSFTQGQYLEAQPVHPSQSLSFQQETCLVELEVLVTYELVQFILSLGNDVEVLEPQELKTQVTQTLVEALDKYNS